MKRFLSSGYFLVVLSAVTLSFKSILIKIGLELGLDAVTLMLMRTYVATPLFVIALLAMEGKGALRLGWNDARMFFFMGIAGMGLAMILSFWSLERIDASLNTVLIFTYPAMTVTIMAFVTGEKVTPGQLASLACTLAGLTLVVRLDRFAEANLSRAGILFALLSAFCFALYNAMGEKMTKRFSPLRVSTYCMIFLTIFFGGFFGNRPYPSGAEAWVIAALLGIVCAFLPFLAYLYGIRRIGASKSAVISTFGPVLTVTWAGLFLGERLDGIQLTGMLLVLFGVMMLRFDIPAGGSERAWRTWSDARKRRRE